MKNPTKIKVVGVGGSGSNAVSRMMRCNIKGVELIAVNTDVQDLQKTRAHRKVRIGRELTRGLGSGMNPDVGRRAAEEQRAEISQILKGTDLVFITYGCGGGTGTGAGPVIAELARNSGALTIAVVTRPFSFEGSQRKTLASKGLAELKDKTDTLLVISNDRLLKIVDDKVSLVNAFWICDEVLRQAVQGISDLIVQPGIINVDFADVQTIMKDAGPALLGMGRAKGENRAEEAARAAISSPLLDFSIEGGKGVLFNVSGGEDMALSEVEQIAKIITEKLHPKAQVIFGAVYDRNLRKGEIKVTVITTGFDKK